MAKRDKRIERMRHNPRTVRPEDLDVVLRAAGFSVRQEGTSHRVYKRGEVTLSVPQDRPYVRAVYVKRALRYLADVEEE